MQDRYQVILLGDKGSGKTSVVMRTQTDSSFDEDVKYTVGYDDYKTQNYTVNKQTYQLRLREYSGAIRYQESVKLSILDNEELKKTKAFSIMFDLTSQKSFEYASNTIKWLETNAPNIPIILVGTKSDKQPHAVTRDDIKKEFFKKYTYVETSAKEDRGINLLMETIIETIVLHENENENDNKGEISLLNENENDLFANKKTQLQHRTPAQRFGRGVGISLLVIAGVFILAAAAYLLLPAAAGAFMVSAGLVVAKGLSFTALITALQATSTFVIAATLGLMAATGVAALAVIGNLANAVSLFATKKEPYTFLKDSKHKDEDVDHTNEVNANPYSSGIFKSQLLLMSVPMNYFSNKDKMKQAVKDAFRNDCKGLENLAIYVRIKDVNAGLYTYDLKDNILSPINSKLKTDEQNALNNIFPEEPYQVIKYMPSAYYQKIFLGEDITLPDHNVGDENNNTNIHVSESEKNSNDFTCK